MFEEVDYGVIEFKLKDLMDKKNITINQMSRKINVAYDIVKKYYYGDNYSISLDILKKFCYILECNIDDIINLCKIREKFEKSLKTV